MAEAIGHQHIVVGEGVAGRRGQGLAGRGDQAAVAIDARLVAVQSGYQRGDPGAGVIEEHLRLDESDRLAADGLRDLELSPERNVLPVEADGCQSVVSFAGMRRDAGIREVGGIADPFVGAGQPVVEIDIAQMRVVVLSGNFVAGAEHDKAPVGAHLRSKGECFAAAERDSVSGHRELCDRGACRKHRRIVGAGNRDGRSLMHRRAVLVDHVVAELGRKGLALGKAVVGRTVGIDRDRVAVRAQCNAGRHAATTHPNKIGDVQHRTVVDIRRVLQQVHTERAGAFFTGPTHRIGGYRRIIGARDVNRRCLVHQRAVFVDHVVTEMSRD